MSKIYVSQGTSPDIVTQETNQTGRFDSILTVEPERGTFLRILSAIARGDDVGVPVYARLKDSNGDLLPTNSRYQFFLSPAGMEATLKISQRVRSISDHNTLSIKEQRNSDHVDTVKVKLQEPETMGGQTLPGGESVDFRDIDVFGVELESTKAIDWAQAEFYIDSTAVTGPFQR